MESTDDSVLLRQYCEKQSEDAFATLVTRYINLVYSVALRQLGNPQQAQDLTQAVFILLARKASGLRHEKALSSWLFRTAHLVAKNFVRSEMRRRHREEEAYMQSSPNEPEVETWQQMAPLLDIAVAALGEKDRQAILLRFFQKKSLSEVGAAIGAGEEAAKKRVSRALEKLREFFAKRGVDSTTAIIGENISAHSVQAAPVALAKAVAAVAVAKGVTGSASTLTLVKGALKVMAWTKVKTAIAASAAILLTAGTAAVVVQRTVGPGRAVLKQWLPDGSLLTLREVSYGDKHEFVEGGKKKSWSWPEHEELVFQLALTGKNAANNPLVRPAFYRQIRGMLQGEQGIEYAEELFELKSGGDGYYGYIQASAFPRDSHWLRLRLEKAATNQPYSGWETLAQFKIANPATFTNSNWTAEAAPISYSTNGMRFVLGDITVKTNIQNNDIWNHAVSAPITVLQNGLPVTNWAPVYIDVADASGNWLSWGGLPSGMSLDPRFVWKLDMDFEPTSDFPADEVATITLPERNSQIVTNVLNTPLTISFDGNWIEASIPTNHSEVALVFVGAKNSEGEALTNPAGNWNQFQFRNGDFMFTRDGVLYGNVGVPSTMTVAIVPNIHTTFYAQPSVVTNSVQ